MNVFIAGCAIALTLSTSPVSARDGHSFSFRDLEYRYDAGDAERIGKHEVAGLVPAGTSVDAATRSMHAAGARCRADANALVCQYTAFEAVEEMPHDLGWTVTMPVSGTQITGAMAERESLGS